MALNMRDYADIIQDCVDAKFLSVDLIVTDTCVKLVTNTYMSIMHFAGHEYRAPYCELVQVFLVHEQQSDCDLFDKAFNRSWQLAEEIQINIDLLIF